MKLSEELTMRGFVSQFSAPALAEIIDGEKRVIYHGIDPSADSAHAGNFVNWMLLRHLSAHGHKIVFLVGGGTGMIGDPKPDTERPLSDPVEVANRVLKLKTQAERILGVADVTFVDNYEWLSQINLLSFLRDIGKHFTVNELLKKDAIARRLEGETGLSYTEFAYPLLQAYDYLVLYRTRGCTLQVGGSDQWGNIVAGVDLVRRLEQVSVHALTVPLIIDKTTGKKFGKSEGNAVWLSADKTSPYQFYQFWLNVADENVIDYLKLFTLLPLPSIAELEAELLHNPGSRVAQRALAKAVTEIVHGESVAISMERVSACLFGDVLIKDLSAEEVALLEEGAPLKDFLEATLLPDLLVSTGLAQSKREARTFIESGAVSLNGQKVVDPLFVVGEGGQAELIHVKRGKKHIALARFK
jgi:tyrosyl-tRNA synthetase